MKYLTKPTTDFKTMKTADATINGFEFMRALKKKQVKAAAGAKSVLSNEPSASDQK